MLHLLCMMCKQCNTMIGSITLKLAFCNCFVRTCTNLAPAPEDDDSDNTQTTETDVEAQQQLEQETQPTHSSPSAVNQSTSTSLLGRKRKRRADDSVTERELLQAITASNDDDLETFGRSVAGTLRRLSHRQQAQAKIRIQEVLYDVEFGSNYGPVTPAVTLGNPVDTVGVAESSNSVLGNILLQCGIVPDDVNANM